MSASTSRCDMLLFGGFMLMGVPVAMLVGSSLARALSWMVFCWVCGALWHLGSIDGRQYRIDPSWLLLLICAGALWQVLVKGPDVEAGVFRALAGAGVGFLVGAIPIAAAAALGWRLPFYPGDAALFAGLGWLLGTVGLFQTLLLGSVVALARHICVQRRRGRACNGSHVALAPGMAVAAAAVFLAANLDFVLGIG